MKNFKIMKAQWAVIPAMVLAFGATADSIPAKDHESVNKNMMDRQATLKRSERNSNKAEDLYVNGGKSGIVRLAQRLFSNATELYSTDDFDGAIKEYRTAKQLLSRYGNLPSFREKMVVCDKMIAKCYVKKAETVMAKADDLENSGDYEGAIKECEEAKKFCKDEPELIAKLDKMIEHCNKQRDNAVMRESYSSEKIMPDQKNQDYQIQKLMEQGRKLTKLKEYSLAMRKFQDVLLINPYNMDAIQSIRGLNNRLAGIGEQRFANVIRRNLADAEWKSTVPIVPEGSSDDGNNVLNNQPVKKRVDKADTIREKLASIIIPKIEFEEFPVEAAIRFLREQSRVNDPEGRGVDIFQIVPQQPIEAAATAADGEQAKPAEAAAEVTLTVAMENKSLLAAIEEICRIGKLNYTIDDHGVVITSGDVALGDTMEARYFSFNTEEKDTESLKAKFAPYDIKFPNGANIFFDNAVNRMVVINTPENLRKIELAIADMEAPEVMIQIMLKFVEISQNDLNELAFNWQVALNTQANPDGTGSAAHMDLNSNELMRYYRPDGMENSSTSNDANLHFQWQDKDGNTLIADLFALNWADSTDVLASPRITTLPDQTATVAMVTKRYFPSSFELIDIENSDTTSGWHMTGADPQPTLDNEQELGINFSVTPTLKIDPNDPNGEARVISAHVDFPIKTFHDWMIFDARSYDGDGSQNGEYYKMPEFDERKIETEIELYDGQTIVLGGVTTDKTSIVHDKIPILGDLPLVGRLFRSEYTKAEKSNLLVFMTCRLVKPDGTARYPESKGTTDMIFSNLR